MRLPPFIFCIAAVSSSTSSAQSITSFYLGPTVGISTPDFGRPNREYGRGLGMTVEYRSPIPSPIVGANAGATINKHLAFDAALQYSFTGQRYKWETVDPRKPYRFYEERLRMRKLAMPVTIGYTAHIGGIHIRAGLGGSVLYLLRSSTLYHPLSNIDGEHAPERRTDVSAPVNLAYGRLQLHPRTSVSVTFWDRLMISAAYTRGKRRDIFYDWWPGWESSLPRNSAIDLTATCLLYRKFASREVQKGKVK